MLKFAFLSERMFEKHSLNISENAESDACEIEFLSCAEAELSLSQSSLSKYKQFQLFEIPKKYLRRENEQRLCVCYSDNFFFCYLWNDEAMKKNYNFIFLKPKRIKERNIFNTKNSKSLFENYNSSPFVRSFVR